MTSNNFVATATMAVYAPIDKVWEAFVNPEIIRQYMFGTTVTSNWEKGSAITWAGELNGKSYEDKGEILDIVPGRKLQYSHISPAAGTTNPIANAHIVTVALSQNEQQTIIHLTQDNNATIDARAASQQHWQMMLEGLKKLLENEPE
jgi:uncharacterized protein YndB with AHSA1/START domain